MGQYDFPSEELKQTNKGAYLAQRTKSQMYFQKLAEFENEYKFHAEQAKLHKRESERYLNLYNELKKENE